MRMKSSVTMISIKEHVWRNNNVKHSDWLIKTSFVSMKLLSLEKLIRKISRLS